MEQLLGNEKSEAKIILQRICQPVCGVLSRAESPPANSKSQSVTLCPTNGGKKLTGDVTCVFHLPRVSVRVLAWASDVLHCRHCSTSRQYCPQTMEQGPQLGVKCLLPALSRPLSCFVQTIKAKHKYYV